MTAAKNILITDSYNRPIATDIFLEEGGRARPVIIYAHGINGFKDWGNFDLIAAQAAAAGFVFVKFNSSFNGTTPEHPEDFTDLEAYGRNTYTKELDNLGAVIDWVCDAENPYASAIDRNRIGLIGHSRGGGIVLLKAAEDPRVKAVATWASVSECKTPWGSWPEERLLEWKEKGVQHLANGRTGQQMPLYYSLYEDYRDHRERLDIQSAIKSLTVPVLICHGTADPAVPVEQAYQLHEWQPEAELFTVDSDHVFGRKHPWTGQDLPQPMQAVLDRTLWFFRKNPGQDL